MDTHVKVLGWLNIALGVLGALLGMGIFILLFSIGVISADRTALNVLTIIGVLTAGILLLLSAPSIIAGVGLLRWQNWARILAIVIGILNLPWFPVGTLVGAYSLYVLLDDETGRLFQP